MTRKFLVPILLPGNPTAALEAAPKQYVDTHLTQAEADPLYVNVSGDTMTGALGVATINGGGTNGSLRCGNNWLPFSDGANYYDATYHSFRTPAGASLVTITGDGRVRITGGAPTTPEELTRKDYVDAQVAIAVQSVVISTTDPIATNPNAELWYDPDA